MRPDEPRRPYGQPLIWTKVQLDPAPAPEPPLVMVQGFKFNGVMLIPELNLPAEWTEERRQAFLEGWNAR